jgi:hypothetical protein
MSLPDGAMAEPLVLSSTAKEQSCTNTEKISAPVVQGAAVFDDQAKLIKTFATNGEIFPQRQGN